MGFGVTELIIILIIVALLFGTKKLRSLGGDLGSAIKSFRGAMKEGEDDQTAPDNTPTKNIIEGEVDTGNDKPEDTS